MKENQIFGYCLMEDDTIHTAQLTLSQAKEAHERHEKFFPDQSWGIQYLGDPKHEKNWAK